MPKLNYILIISLSLLWPIIEIFVFRLRFSSVDFSMVLESLKFLPLGLTSGLLTDFFLKKGETFRQKIGILLGYLLAIPTAIFTSLLGGLIFNPIIGATIFGLIPLAIGQLAGILIAKKLDQIKKEGA